MTNIEAQNILKQCRLNVLVDHSFGDTEYMWLTGEQIPYKVVAVGYSSSQGSCSVTMLADKPNESGHVPSLADFYGEDARVMFNCYLTMKVESNNE